MHSLNTGGNLIEITICIPSKNVVQQSAIGKYYVTMCVYSKHTIYPSLTTHTIFAADC